MFMINSTSHPIRLREGIFNDGILLQPGESREVGGLAEQIDGSSVVARWGYAGLLAEGDPACQAFIAERLAGLKAVGDAELAAAGIGGAVSADRHGLKFRVQVPRAARSILPKITAALEASTGMGPSALLVEEA